MSSNQLFHKHINRLAHLFDGFVVIFGDGLDDAALHMFFQKQFAGIVDLGAHRSELNQHIGAVFSVLQHLFAGS